MNAKFQKPKYKKQRGIRGLTNGIISRQGEKLSQCPPSNIGLLACLLIIVCGVVLIVHWPALSAEALSFDDDQYLTKNMLVQNPGWTSARRFLTEILEPSTVGGYYQPLTMISLMADCALGGRAVLEKLPLFVIGGVSAAITYISQNRTCIAVLPGEFGPERIPLTLCHNIIFYLHKIIFPANLSLHYAFPEPFALSNPIVLRGLVGTCILLLFLLVSLRWTGLKLGLNWV